MHCCGRLFFPLVDGYMLLLGYFQLDTSITCMCEYVAYMWVSMVQVTTCLDDLPQVDWTDYFKFILVGFFMMPKC
jgi:hypothetical protein